MHALLAQLPCRCSGVEVLWFARVLQESGSPISRFMTQTMVSTIDVQPAGPDLTAIVAYVTGQIKVEGEEDGKEQRYRCDL